MFSCLVGEITDDLNLTGLTGAIAANCLRMIRSDFLVFFLFSLFSSLCILSISLGVYHSALFSSFDNSCLRLATTRIVTVSSHAIFLLAMRWTVTFSFQVICVLDRLDEERIDESDLILQYPIRPYRDGEIGMLDMMWNGFIIVTLDASNLWMQRQRFSPAIQSGEKVFRIKIILIFVVKKVCEPRLRGNTYALVFLVIF